MNTLDLSNEELDYLYELLLKDRQNGNGFFAYHVRRYAYLHDLLRERKFRDVEYSLSKKVEELKND